MLKIKLIQPFCRLFWSKFSVLRAFLLSCWILEIFSLNLKLALWPFLLSFHLHKRSEGDGFDTGSKHQRKLLYWLQFGPGHLDCLLFFISRHWTLINLSLADVNVLPTDFSYHCGLWKSKFSNHLSLLDCSLISN